MITFRQKGDFSKLTRFLERAKESVRLGDLDKYGREGVAALASATPVDTGRTANSWHRLTQVTLHLVIGASVSWLMLSIMKQKVLMYCGHSHLRLSFQLSLREFLVSQTA